MLNIDIYLRSADACCCCWWAARAVAVNRWISVSGKSWSSLRARGNSCWKAELWPLPPFEPDDWPDEPGSFSSSSGASFKWTKRTEAGVELTTGLSLVKFSSPVAAAEEEEGWAVVVEEEATEDDEEEEDDEFAALAEAPRHNLPPLRMPVRGGSGRVGGSTTTGASGCGGAVVVDDAVQPLAFSSLLTTASSSSGSISSAASSSSSYSSGQWSSSPQPINKNKKNKNNNKKTRSVGQSVNGVAYYSD